MASPASLPGFQSATRRPFLRRFALAACFALLVTGALWITLHQSAAPASTVPRTVPFAAGDRLIYHVAYAGSSASDFGAVWGQGPSLLSHAFQQILDGELTVTVLDAGPEQFSLVYHLSPNEVQLIADGDEAPTEAMRADLMQPIFAILDSRGRIVSLRFDPAASPQVQHLTRTLLAATQVVLPAPSKEPSVWQTEEDDPNGVFQAEYQVQEDGTVRKTKLRYEIAKPGRKNAIVLTPAIRPEGETLASFDATGYLVELSAAERQHLTIKGKTLGKGELHLDLSLVQRAKATHVELATLRAAAAERKRIAAAVALSVAKSAAETQLTIQRQQLGDASLEDVLSDLAQIERSVPPNDDLTRLFLKCKALLIVRPESCVRLGELLASADPGSLKTRIVIDALEAAGHAQAQAALSTAIHAKPADTPALALLIPSLGTAPSPTPETVQTLEALAFGNHDPTIVAAARLAFGNLARNLGDEAPARSDKIVDRLLKELTAGTSPSATWQLLLALGNAGSRQALPTLTRFLDDTAPDLRGAAAWALRWIDSPQADTLLTTKVLHCDSDPAVRLEAVRALGFRERPANLQAQEKALAKEQAVSVRLALLGNLWDARESYPPSCRVVEQASVNDPAAEVRETARRMLQSAPTL